MDQFEQMKVTRQAMNGKMCLMFGGIFLDVFSHYLHDHVWNQFLYDSSGSRQRELQSM